MELFPDLVLIDDHFETFSNTSTGANFSSGELQSTVESVLAAASLPIQPFIRSTQFKKGDS